MTEYEQTALSEAMIKAAEKSNQGREHAKNKVQRDLCDVQVALVLCSQL
jgi:hypothetical protein